MKRKGFYAKEMPQFLLILGSLGRVNCIEWLYYKANILIICGPFVLQFVSESDFGVYNNIQLDSLQRLSVFC